ncbi:MAG TPA: hypothetical protein VLX68_05485 [Chitinivibrionales bacterium]|nr:hypothetical protein [Chitinivibrionales bacterium]
MNTFMFRIVLFVAVLLSVASSACAVGWVSPTGYLDEEGGQWTNLQNAYDNPVQPTVNYATNSPRLGWAGWADFSLPAPINCGRVRVDCDFGYSHVDSVQVDVWNSDLSSWQNIFGGTVTDGQYTELTFSPRNVSKMRFRYHYINASWQFWLYEVGLYQSASQIVAPTVVTLDATSVDTASADIHGLINDEGGEPCQTWLEYGPTTAYGSTTAIQTGGLTGQTFGAFLGGLSGTYHFRAAASNSAGTSYGNDLAFTVSSVPLTGWVSPTGSFTDSTPPTPNSGGWTNMPAAYDDEGLTGTNLTHTINDASPGPYLYLTTKKLYADKIRFMAKKTAEITSVDIWLLIRGTWTNVFPSGTFNDAAGGTVWNEVAFSADSVSQARIRFNVPTNYGLLLTVYEFDFHTVGIEHCAAFVDGAFVGATK